MWKYIILVCFQFTRYCHGEMYPCDNATQLPFITQRVVNYTLGTGEQPICDRYLRTAWYEMGSYVLANTTDGCGTTYNWYMKDGNLPSNGMTNVTVCRYDNPIYQCEDGMPITVQKCGDNYIFLLQKLLFCDEAYCIRSLYAKNESEEAPDISQIRPQIITDLMPVDLYNSELIFYCDFDTIPSTSYYYMIEWRLTTGFTTTRLIHRTSAFEYTDNDKANFLKNTALTEYILRQRGIDSLGFTIVCSVVASKDIGGKLSQTIVSPHKFCGIEVLQRTVTVRDGNDVTIDLRLTVPFHCKSSNCQIRLEMYIPRVKDKCSISEIAAVEGEQIGCGVMFGKEDVGKTKTFKISSKFGSQLHNTDDVYGVLFKTVGHRSHKIFGDYTPDSVRVHMIQNTKVLSGLQCYAHSDPHIWTFDKEKYDNHMDGVFILYRNNRYKTEVQIKTDKCLNYDTASWKPMCNCGVAIRTGRDVFVMNKCNSSRWDVSFRYCEDRILRRSVKKHSNGQQFTIKLPTGTIVKVRIGSFAEIEIQPSLLDKSKVDGLCGNFDSRQDIYTLSATQLRQFIIDSRVTADNDLFKNTYQHLESWGEEIYLCTCENPFEFGLDEALFANATCKTDDKKRTCEDGPFTNVDDFQVCSVERKKRGVDGYLNADRIIDRHRNVKTDFRSIYPKQTENRKMYIRSTFSNETAYENCISLMNTTAFRMCSNIPTLDLEPYIDNCVNDALASDSMMWTQLHIEELKQMCVRTVEENQPIPPEVLDKIQNLTSSLNFSSNDDTDNLTTTSPTVGTTTPLSSTDTEFTQSLLDDLKSVSCPYDCNGHGKCNVGVCICEDGYISDDCSISRNEPPIMKGIPDSGLCDLRQRECLRTSVFGEKFVSSNNLSCKVTSFKMDVSGHIQKEDVSIQNASLHTFEEVICSLHFEREKRALTSDIDNYRARGYQVSVSNDGIHFSEADVIVIFDSKCVTCNKTDEMFICQTKPGFCQSNGMCYSKDETIGCYTCSGESTSGLRWTPGPECPVSVQQPDEGGNNRLWLIGATVGPVVAIVIILVIVCYALKRKPQYAGKVMYPVDPVK